MKLPNGYGTVYKLSGRRRKPWIARKTVGWDNGKQIVSTIGTYKTKSEALQALSDYNNNPYDLIVSKSTFADIYKRWYDDTFDDNSNYNTVKGYEAAYLNCSKIYNMQMVDIRTSHLQDVLDNCGKNYETVRRTRILFNKIYDYCLYYEYVTKNYAENLKINAEKKKQERQAFSSEEIKRLWELSDTNQFVPIVLMLIYSGLRISELLNLKKEDTHIDKQWFYVRASKTDAGIRVVPIADKVLHFWQDYMQKSKCEYVVCTVDGKRLNYDNFTRRYWKPLMKELNFNHTIHETRHTFVSQMVMKNVNQTILKKIVGHKSLMSLTEKVYTHIEIQELLNEVNKL